MSAAKPSESKLVKFYKALKKLSTQQIFTAMVLLMWATSFLMSVFNPKYEPPEYVNPLIMLVGAYLFAKSTADKEKK